MKIMYVFVYKHRGTIKVNDAKVDIYEEPLKYEKEGQEFKFFDFIVDINIFGNVK